MKKIPAESIPFESWKAEKKRSLERVRVQKLQQALKKAMDKALSQPPDASPPRMPRTRNT